MKGINMSEKVNMDKLKESTEKFQEEMVKETDLLKMKKLIKPEGKQLTIGEITILEGDETVLDSIKLDPQFCENLEPED